MKLEQIVINPVDLWQIIVAICGGIIALSGAGAVIAGIVHRAKAPNEKQNERIAATETEISAVKDDIKKINERLDLDNNRFVDYAGKMNEIEQTMKKTNQIIISSLQALIAHSIDGNNVDQLKSAEKSLNDFLVGKI